MNLESSDLKILVGCINVDKFKDENFLRSIVGAFFKSAEGFVFGRIMKSMYRTNGNSK